MKTAILVMLAAIILAAASAEGVWAIGIERHLPVSLQPNVPSEVRLSVDLSGSNYAFLMIEETVPQGWMLGGSSEGNYVFDPKTGKIRWSWERSGAFLPMFKNNSIMYVLVPRSGDASFFGEWAIVPESGSPVFGVIGGDQGHGLIDPDTNMDGRIDTRELMKFIGKWVKGEVGFNSMLVAIARWVMS